MATHDTNNQNSYVYLGLAGETGPGRVVQSGLFRIVFWRVIARPNYKLLGQ
jgi:hypothetical protein